MLHLPLHEPDNFLSLFKRLLHVIVTIYQDDATCRSHVTQSRSSWPLSIRPRP
jgi:hypothetical protein